MSTYDNKIVNKSQVSKGLEWEATPTYKNNCVHSSVILFSKDMCVLGWTHDDNLMFI